MRVKAADSHSVPIFNTGVEHWNIVNEEDEKDYQCSIMFPSKDPRDPEYKEYMAQQKLRAQVLAAVINEGLEVMSHGS